MNKNTYPKGFAPRGEQFEKAQKIKQEVYSFLKEAMEEASEKAFKALGIHCTEKHAGEYGDGSVYGAGLGEGGACNIKVGSKTNSYLEKQISYGGKRMFVEASFEIDGIKEMIHMIYRTTEKAVSQGHGEFEGGFFVHENMHMSLSDMKKFKKDMKKILDEAAKKEAAYLTQSKLGVDDRIETDTTQTVAESIVGGDVESFLSNMDNLFESDGIDDDEQAKEDALIKSKIQEEERMKLKKKNIDDGGANPNRRPKLKKKDIDDGDLEEMTTSGGGGGGGSAGAFGYDAPLGGVKKRKLKSSAPFDQVVNENILRESLTSKGIEQVKSMVEKLGARKTAEKMIDLALNKTIGMSANDLPDTAIFADGLDEVEELIHQSDFSEAFRVAKETAAYMVSDEMGGMGEFFENKGFSEGKKGYNFEVYHETLSGALETAQDFAREKGYEISDEDLFQFGIGGISYDVTKRVSFELTKNGELAKNMLHVQMYRMGSGKYELNMYFDNSKKLNEKKDFDPRFKETAYYQKMMKDELKGQGNVRLVQEKNEKGDDFWTVVSPEVMKRYEKNHIMGAPGAEGVEPNSEEEENLAKGHGQKHGGGKKKKKTTNENLKPRFAPRLKHQSNPEINDSGEEENRGEKNKFSPRLKHQANPIDENGDEGNKKIEGQKFNIDINQSSFDGEVNSKWSMTEFNGSRYGSWEDAMKDLVQKWTENPEMHSFFRFNLETSDDLEIGNQEFSGADIHDFLDLEKSQEQFKNNDYANEYMGIDESVRKRYKPQRSKTQDEINDRWKTLTNFSKRQTIKEAEDKADKYKSPFEGREEKKPLNEVQLKSTVRNQYLTEGSIVDGKKIILVKNSRSREYLMFESDANDSKKAFCFDFVTGMRVSNPNFKL